MGRWSHLDSDDDRLPPGMSRMGYDADTQTYSYRDSDGSYWEGAPGCKYGKLHRVQNAAPPLPSINIPVDPAGLDQRHRFILHDYDDESEYDPYDSDDNKSYKQGDDEELPTTNAYNNEKKQLQLQLPTFESLTNNPSRPNSPSRPQHQQQQHQRPHLPDHQPEPSRKSIAERATSSGSGSQKKPSLLKRTGTLSRITRFLSLSSSSSSRARSAAAVSRRATDAGRSQPLAYSEGGGGGGGGGSSGRWPGQVQGGAGSNSAPRRARGRATTFDEILGVGDRAR